MLRKNQIDAINCSINNDFESGIHFHTTGTGKSWIAMSILDEYNKKYPKKNVLWICERKDILKEQFSSKKIKERNFNSILKNYNILNFVENKETKWFNSLNVSHFWGKPFLCIINRCFLTSKKKYENIKANIGLIIHDECHTIENASTSEFYNWLSSSTRVIGFSATPEKIYPLNNILSSYDIYSAFCDNVIVPPKIMWFNNKDNILCSIKCEIDKLPYKKIIVWCGMIQECIDTAELWKDLFHDYDICMDFNNIAKNKYYDYEHFYNKIEKSILFCAVKHREGSDIPNIDGCIFTDLVSKRSERVFIQSMGRVLRKDKLNNKKYGLVIDINVSSTIDICNRVQKYLKLDNIFPWYYEMIDNNINYLTMIKTDPIKSNDLTKSYTKNEIMFKFKRNLPNLKKYRERLDHELDLIFKKDVYQNIVRALEILDLTQDIPHVTRGSCGSSLLCYLLGISHVDPINYNICFARFLNKYRDNLPDIDFDFPHYFRNEVFLKLFQKWGNKVARISNHNYYHEKSALREALRQNGINYFISKYDLNKEIKSFSEELQQKIYRKQKELEGQFRGFSLHCGGIIYFPDGIPEEHKIESSTSIIQQVDFNKIDVAENKNFKIDILSSRGLSQLYFCDNSINFNKHIGDLKTIELLCSGDNIGITLAETPLMRKALILIKPKTIMDLAVCLSIIRPAAKDAKKEFELGKYNNKSLVFDDDVIYILSELINCSYDKADFYRRKYTKEDKEIMNKINQHLTTKTQEERNRLKAVLENLRKYGFCKAHALSYAQLVWQLAYQKAHNTKKFWTSTLKNSDSCYRKWVHLHEANKFEVLKDIRGKSIYAKHKAKTYENDLDMLRNLGYWNFTNNYFWKDYYYFTNKDRHVFKGIIANSRMLNYGSLKHLLLFVYVSPNKKIEIVVSGTYINYNTKKITVKGSGVLGNNIYKTIKCNYREITFTE